MEKIDGMHKLVGLFWSRTPTFSRGTPTFCQMGVLNCFQNPSESSVIVSNWRNSVVEQHSDYSRQRIINDLNSLPEGAVLAKDVYEFKSKVDHHWNHKVIYVY